MSSSLFVFVVVALVGVQAQVDNQVTPPSTTSVPHPAYQPQENQPSPSSYVPHVTYPYSDAYGPVQPYESFYPGFSYPTSYLTSLTFGAENVLSYAIHFIANVWKFVLGSALLLILGSIFTTAVCAVSSICTISFNGFDSLDKDTMRAMMTPEKISTAAALVQDAIGKYQRMQRAARQ